MLRGFARDKKEVREFSILTSPLKLGKLFLVDPLYKWLSKNGDVLGDYFGLADSVMLSAQEFSWRDLVVDILVLPTGQIEMLDEDEIPECLDETLRACIESGKQTVLRNYRAVVVEMTTMLGLGRK